MLARRVSRNFVSLAVAFALVLSACGDDGDEDGATPTTTATAPQAVELVAPLTAQLEGVVEDTVAELGAPGAVVVVTTPEGRWESAVGVTDLASGEPMVRGLRWPLRSITKSFTTTLILQLADEGALSLDDPVGRWVPGVPNGDEVTLRQLGDMRSGLADYTSEAWIEEFVADPTRSFSLDELIAFGIAEDPEGEPGAARVYTNLNTLLLGKVVEEVTQQPFEAALAERILEPLGMTDTIYPTDPSQWSTDATGYQPDEAGSLEEQPVNYSVFGPAGAAIATIDDLLVWGRALATGELVDADTQQARLDGGVLEEGPEYDEYAFGIGEIDGWWGHTGEGFGFTALVMHDVDTDTTVAIAMNASLLASHGPTTLFRRLVPLLSAA
jgi:D-alanyl-D-alanine carboxypeptidase